MTIRLHLTAAPIHTLGPFSRFGVWVQGCCRGCPGCITPDAQPMDGGYEMEVADLATLILRYPEVEGLTISGGEPFLQSDALCTLIRRVRQIAPLGVIVYTGFTFEEIQDNPLTDLCDAIIDGPYLAELNDERSLRGSSNQRLILLSSRYEGLIPFGTVQRQTEWVQPTGGGLAQVGIPSQQDIQKACSLQSSLQRKCATWETETC